MSRPTRALVAVVVLLTFGAGMAGGALLTGGSAPTASTGSKARPAAPARQPGDRRSGPGPSTERFGMPAGFARSEEGARAAAIAYATASQRWLYMTDEQITAAVGAIAAAEAAQALTREVLAEVGLARDGLGRSPGRVWWLVRPLAWRVQAYSPERARVSVWTVTVLSAADVAVPQSDWLTVTVELVWESGDWRAEAVGDRPGPTPLVGTRDKAWQPEAFEEALAGFQRVDAKAAP